jgi:tRNA G18 (ribose-2'-O)-methylase SpoU
LLKIKEMNKKTIIIGLIITGVVVVGGIYLYRRNKKAKEVVVTDPNAVTEADAMEVLDLLNKKDTPLSADNSKLFVDIYVKNIKKDTHAQLKTLLSKKESDWTTQDKLTFLILLDKVLKPLKDKISTEKK